MTDFEASVEKNIGTVKELFGGSSDLNIQKVNVGGILCAVITLEGLVTSKDLAKMLFDPIMEHTKDKMTQREVFRFFALDGIFACDTKPVNTLSELEKYLCFGFAIVFVDGISRGMAYGAQGYAIRAISEPTTENNVKGAKEAYNENLRTNMSLIRRRIQSSLLRFEFLEAGKLSSTALCLVYVEGKAPKKLLEDVKKRIKEISSDVILTSANVISFLTRSKNLFSSASTTERPDTTVAKLSEGRAAILIDGIPFAVIVPTLFIENFQTVDDYCEKPIFVFFLRTLRLIAFFVATLLPGVYVAAATLHPNVLARALLLNLMASAETTPYSLVAEMVIVIVMFEILKEAGLRLPKAIGGAVSIVGGLIIGDAAVTSGLLSAPIIIIIGITATSSFVLPELNAQTSILRILNVFVGATLGFFGIAVLGSVTLVSICAKETFCVPYLAPVAPFSLRAMQDTFWRKSIRKLKTPVKISRLNGVENEDE